MRTMQMPPRKDAAEGVVDAPHCICCGKKVNPKRMWAVHVIDGGSHALHPDDEHMYRPDGGDCGCHMVGSECRKVFGEFAFKWQ